MTVSPAAITSSARVVAPIHELHVASFQEKAPLVVPVSSTDEIVKAWDSFKELKLRLLNNADFVEIKGEKYAKKSAFRKLALAFGISVELVREERIEFKESTAFLLTAKASSPNGRFMTAAGSCHTDEKRFNKTSDARAVAQTRATNRAIADLIGWSAPSAEEMVGGGEVEQAVADPSYPRQADEWHNRPPESQNTMTVRQRGLLVSLINKKIADPEEREDALSSMESYCKEEASHVISDYLELQPA